MRLLVLGASGQCGRILVELAAAAGHQVSAQLRDGADYTPPPGVAALRGDPKHRMAGMLDTALQSGMRPEQIRELAGTGYRLARRLGVRLPPRQAFGRRAV